MLMLFFFAAGHGESKKFLEQNKIADSIKIIDLANDFRLIPDSKIGNREFVYGLPELKREKIKKANNIANPGCFATTIQLGYCLWPKQVYCRKIFIQQALPAAQELDKVCLPLRILAGDKIISLHIKHLTHQHNGDTTIVASIAKCFPCWQKILM
jgi:N-acetyl-gamma-glutamyl-phosphate reductase